MIDTEFAVIMGTAALAMLIASLTGMFLGYLLGRMHMFKMVMDLPFVDTQAKSDLAVYFKMEKLLEVKT